MTDEEGREKAPPAQHRNLIELLSTWEPLPEGEGFPEIDDPPPEPVTCFDDWVDEPEEALANA